MTDAERRSALEVIASEVRVCTKCRLHETRTRAVPGEGNADTEVVFVGEGPGFNEDREGRPFVGRAGAPAREAPRLDRVATRGRLHHERRQVPAAGEPRPAARRDRGVRAVSWSVSSGCWIRRSSSLWGAIRWAGSCPARGSRRRTGRSVRSTRPPARRTRSPSRCTTRPRRSGVRPSNATATRTSRACRSRYSTLARAGQRRPPKSPTNQPANRRLADADLDAALEPDAAPGARAGPRARAEPRPRRPFADVGGPSRHHRLQRNGRSRLALDCRSRGRIERRADTPTDPLLTPRPAKDANANDQRPATPDHPARRGGGDRQEHVRLRIWRRDRRHRLRADVPRRGDVRHRPRHPRHHLSQGTPRQRQGVRHHPCP